ncbi:MAG: sulfite exporter TauE/SafE family protein [Alphaproteobacteria bacterium]|nr:sulfite exporter TauE/SafE family protein [Alphaproteobacteria bacterium]
MGSDVLLILAGALSGGFVLGLTGFGNGLTAYGLWLHVLTPQISAPLVAIGSILGHLLMFRGFRHAMARDRILPIVIGGLAGVPFGVWLLTVIEADTFRLFGGLLLAAYSFVSLVGGLRLRIAGKTPARDALIGWLGGLCGGLASLSGPFMTVWCGLKGWTPDEQRAAYQPYNFAMLSAALVGFGLAGFLTLELAYVASLSVPATLLGVWTGRMCYGRVNAMLFRKIVLILLTTSGLMLVAQSLV